MTMPLYVIQVLTIAGVVYFLVPKQPRLLRIQTMFWLAATLVISWRYGIDGQVNFYSNDQRSYTDAVQSFSAVGIPMDLEVWLTRRITYTFPSLPLAAIGIHPTLALKTVSLLWYLALLQRLLSDSARTGRNSQAVTLWLTACGAIGTFFSLLALRETMMMYFVYRFATDRSIGVRVISLTILFFLRQHLAAALLVAELVVSIWRWLRSRRNFGVVESPALIAIGVILGTVLYHFGSGGFSPLTPFSPDWGISQATRISSNFVGLQFLTGRQDMVEFSLFRLLILRFVLNETLIIPTAFIAICLCASRWINDRDRVTLLAFTIYVSLVIGTDFNSFRQNIPLMPLMGLTITGFVASQRSEARRVPNPTSQYQDSTITLRGT